MNQKVSRFKKYLAILLIAFVVFANSPVSYVFAVPEPPTAPSAPEAPTPPTAPDAPVSPEAPSNEDTALIPPPTPDGDSEVPTPPDAPEPPDGPGDTEDWVYPGPEQQEGENQQENSDQEADYSEGAGTNNNGSADGASIETGDATNTATISTIGNINTSAGGSRTGTGASVENTGNGDGSVNSGSATIIDNDNTSQENSASVVNNLDQNTVSGDNSTSFNVGDSSIKTGDANTSGTVITAVNTNVDGVAVAEFNVVDDHVGDIILDFGENCISGCGGGGVEIENSGNGADSLNFADADVTSNDVTDQVNDAAIVSNLDLSSDSGNNNANFNTSGDSSIVTGDANVAANVLTFVNNNIAGNVVLGVVNIFGNLVGDIILTEEALNAYCGGCLGGTSVKNANNSTDSTNLASADQVENNDASQFNNADIDNNLVLNANTGDNYTNSNTGGDSTIQTGDANIDASVLNIANMNLVGGNWWLVIVNEAGKWFGKILGSPDGSYFAGSEGIEFVVDENGEVIAANAGNGSGSTNVASASQTTNTKVSQDNNAVIENNINLSANTGGNGASFNTGGNSSIVTGDANIIANIVNFVNNNITGGGTLFVNVINVFGSWFGDFVSPGMEKEEEQQNYADSGGGVGGNGGDSTGSYGSGGPSAGGSQSGGSSENGGSGTQDSEESGEVAGIVLSEDTLSPTPSFSSGGTLASATLDSGMGLNSDEAVGFAEISGGGLDNSKNVLNINLAWLVLLIPAYILLALFRKTGFLVNLLPNRIGR